jgi:superfamily II helicase
VLVREITPEEAAAAVPKSDACDRCGSADDLRQVSLHGRVGYAERTLCAHCAETLWELFIDTASD